MNEEQIKPIIAWAGVADNKFDTGWDEEQKFKDGQFGIYKTFAEARNHYQAVIKVKITPYEPNT